MAILMQGIQTGANRLQLPDTGAVRARIAEDERHPSEHGHIFRRLADLPSGRHQAALRLTEQRLEPGLGGLRPLAAAAGSRQQFPVEMIATDITF